MTIPPPDVLSPNRIGPPLASLDMGFVNYAHGDSAIPVLGPIGVLLAGIDDETAIAEHAAEAGQGASTFVDTVQPGEDGHFTVLRVVNSIANEATFLPVYLQCGAGEFQYRPRVGSSAGDGDGKYAFRDMRSGHDSILNVGILG